MNREYILFHLKEAQEEIESTIAEIEKDSEYGYGNYVVSMSHSYHHVNTAWNARDVSNENAERCSNEDFNKWRQFPDSNELLLNE